MQHKRTAFSMIELVFVIVIMGILGKFGVSFLFQAYNNFISSKINNELQSKSESTIEFSASRLQYRIKDSVIVRRDINDSNATYIADANDSNYSALEWVGTDSDGFRGDKLPNWSGIIDLNSTDTNGSRLYSPETNTTKENDFIQALSNNTTDINDSAIYFLGSLDSDIHHGYGWEDNITDQNQTMHPINSDTNKSIFVPAPGTGDFHDVGEQYKLAWSAYALSLEDYNTTTKMGNLYFYYNFQPWNGKQAKDGNRTLLMKNVNTFQFTTIDSLLKLQICVKSDLVEDYSLCKEKTIF